MIVHQVPEEETKTMETKLMKAKNKFYNYYSWSMIHGLTSKTVHSCEQTCSKLVWKNYCCANVGMTYTLASEKLFMRQDIECLRSDI